MSYQKAAAYLDALGIDAMKDVKPTLERIEALCAALDNPQRSVPVLHVTGTNGKSSVARIATAVLGAAGLSVGTFTSPHLQNVRERIAHNGEPISEDDFGSLFEQVKPYIDLVEDRLDETLTYFELLTAMFYLWAADRPVDAAVVEVGLGGRWDATNVVEAPVSVITNIALDHTEFMGNDRRGIAAEKAGIVKSDAVVVTGERDPEILSIFRDVADERHAQLLVADRHFGVIENKVALGGRYLTMRTNAREYDGLFLPLHGAHQGSNAAVALQAVTSFLPAQEISEDVVNEAFAAVTAPGRIETIAREGKPPIVLDVAHNPDGMSAFVTALTETFAFERIVVVLGVLRGKDHVGMLRELARVPCLLVLAEPSSSRALPVVELDATAQELGLESVVARSVPEAIETALETAGGSDLICITGSHYVIGEARTYLHA
ncbi:MAG: bifunctional folylpolyglutamate synthase/dihydrofolate synthase [Actinobacteria bacterium]|nr:bifunctional folylpolyglutamate synthase/dihydrofolate synthase [Actinomycetota bacterium]